MLRPILLALCLLCSAAQATEPLPRGIEYSPPAPVAEAPARLIISRDNNAPNACDVEIYLDEQVVATLGPGEHTSLDLPSGQLSIAAALSSSGYCAGNGPQALQSVLLGPGETRQFSVIVEPGEVFLAPLLD